MRLPADYNARLQRYDNCLRMRWSDARECWVLERRVARAKLPDRPLHTLPEDTRILLRDGYMKLDEYGPRELPHIDRLLNCLAWGDTWQMGKTPDAIADQMDQQWVANYRERRRKSSSLTGDYAVDAWDDFAWQQKLRVSVPGTYAG